MQVAIIVAVLLVMVVTAVNDWQKERQFQRLQQSVSDTHMFSVVRNGEGREVNVREIVVGDVILLKYGDSIPADGLLLRCSDLQVDESAMTGESKLVRKEVPGAPLVLSGTSVMQGSGKVLVTAVGSNSQAGVIQTLLAGEGEDEEERSVLHGKLVRLAKQIAAVAAGVALITLGVLVIRQVMIEKTEEEAKAEQQAKAYVAHVMTAITVLVVAIPEGLPLAVTLALAYSVKKTTADHNRVRHLHACETMGNATTICTDKTGTLTTNRMAVVRTFLCGERGARAPPRPPWSPPCRPRPGSCWARRWPTTAPTPAGWRRETAWPSRPPWSPPCRPRPGSCWARRWPTTAPTPAGWRR